MAFQREDVVNLKEGLNNKLPKEEAEKTMDYQGIAAIPESSVEKKNRVHLVLYLLVFGFLVSSGVALYFYSRANQVAKNPQEATQQEIASLVAQVGRLIVLPENETPTIATVTEPERLKDQTFFANAKKGYKVLIYATAKKAILYDPEQNKIVEVAPVSFDNQ